MRSLVLGVAALAGATVTWFAAGSAGAPSASAARPSTVTVPERQSVQALTAFEIRRTERFLESRAACLGCHRIAGRGGAIGPSLEGLAERVDADYVRRVIRDAASVIPGTLMPRQPMPDAEVERLTAYLLSPPPAAAASAPAVQPQAPAAIADAQREDGAALYARHCAACHGPEGGGDGWNAPALPVAPTAHADASLMSGRTDDALFDAISSGAYVLDGSARMPPFGEMLSAAQIRALVAHIRALCGCTEPSWAGNR